MGQRVLSQKSAQRITIDERQAGVRNNQRRLAKKALNQRLAPISGVHDLQRKPPQRFAVHASRVVVGLGDHDAESQFRLP
jgi:hypothetical protein